MGHAARWEYLRVIYGRYSKAEGNGTIIQREKEYFTNELTLVFANGRTAILK